MNPEQWRETVRQVLTTLAHDARQALSPEQYEEALESAENWVMNTLYSCWRNPAVGIDQQPADGVWRYRFNSGWGGHVRLEDEGGRLVGYLSKTHDGRWEAHLQPDWTPLIEKGGAE